MAVQLNDCKAGDVVFFKPQGEPADYKAPRGGYRIGTVRAVQIGRGQLMVDYRAIVAGQVEKVVGYVSPSDVIGFHVAGTPV